MSGPRPIGLSMLGLVALLSSAGAAGLSALGGWSNPMSARGDLVYQGDGGAARVAIGADAASGAGAGGATITNVRAGEGWLRLDWSGAYIRAFGGVGSAGAEPTTWTPISHTALSATDPYPQRVFFGFHASSPASPTTITWDSVRLQPVE